MRLDELYKMTAFIYQDANLTRSREATFLHFVEICSLLTQADRKKKKVNVDIPSAICKALGWYFPLLARMGVRSAEELIFRKFPYACPYCRKAPHQEEECKLIKGAEDTVSHSELTALFETNEAQKPQNLNGWMQMFRDIYPRSLNAPPGFSTIALFEELGELAESIRVFDMYPHYFYGEAADIFSYLMGIANEYRIGLDAPDSFDLQKEFLARYPGLCVNCGSKSCMCPAIPKATVGRMAKELRIDVREYQIQSFESFSAQGREASSEVFKNSGFNPEIARRLPFDRGDLNAALTQLALRVANALATDNQEHADRLRKDVLEVGRSERGTAAREDTAPQLIALLKEAWGSLDSNVQAEIRSETASSGDLTHLFEKRVLFVSANPDRESAKALALDEEFKAIKSAFKRNGIQAHIEPLLAATADDLRRTLMEEQFDLIHFSGHADDEGLALIGSNSSEATLAYPVLSKMLAEQENVQCVVLNGCHTGSGAEEIGCPLTIALLDELEDEAALAFTTGFYEAIAAQKTVSSAYDQGVIAVESIDHNPHAIAKFKPA